MTRDEARKLLSGYATGSLTELERQLLFDAALEDQELYDELAAEQELKELIELPGAKQRLIAALGPEPEVVKTVRWWPWVAGAIALASITLVLWITRPPSVSAPVQVAEVTRKVETRETEPTQAAPPVVAERRAPPPEVDQLTNTAPATPKETAAAKDLIAANELSATAPVASPLAEVVQPAKPTPQLAAAPPPPPPPAARAIAPGTLAAGKGKAAPLGAAVEAQGGFAPAAGFLADRRDTSVATGDALTYEVKDTGILRIIPLRTGVLEVTFEGRPLFPSNPVVSGTPIEISIPLEAKQLRIDFAANSSIPAPAAVQSQQSTGTLALPAGPNPRAVALIPAQR